jgi:hypothetical protein
MRFYTEFWTSLLMSASQNVVAKMPHWRRKELIIYMVMPRFYLDSALLYIRNICNEIYYNYLTLKISRHIKNDFKIFILQDITIYQYQF